MEELVLKSHGDIKASSDWGGREVKFESGKIQVQRTQVSPDKTWTLTYSGLHKDREYLEKFFDERAGNYEPFYCEINGVREIVKFANAKIEFDEIREAGKPVGYSTQLTLRRHKP